MQQILDRPGGQGRDDADALALDPHLEVHEVLLVPLVGLLGRGGNGEQLGAAQGLGDVAVRRLREADHEDLLVPPGAGDGELRRQARGAVAHHESLAGGEAGVRVVGEDLHGHLAADAVRLADAGDADEVVLGCGTHGLSWVGRSVAGGGGAADDDGPPAR